MSSATSRFRLLLVDFDDTLVHLAPLQKALFGGMGARLAQERGGSAESWSAHAADLFSRAEADYVSRFAGRPLNGYCAWLAGTRQAMALELFGATCCGDALDAMHRLYQSVPLNPNAILLPGALACLQVLSRHGVPVYLASGNDSLHLETVSGALGLLPYLRVHFGPDKLDCAKEGPEFYARICAELHAEPKQVVVADDQPSALTWALEAGCTTVQVALPEIGPRDPAPGAIRLVTALSQLSAFALSRFPQGQYG